MGYRDIDQQMFRTLKKTKPQNCPDNRLVRLKRTLMKHIDDVPSSGIITKKNLCVGIYSAFEYLTVSLIIWQCLSLFDSTFDYFTVIIIKYTCVPLLTLRCPLQSVHSSPSPLSRSFGNTCDSIEVIHGLCSVLNSFKTIWIWCLYKNPWPLFFQKY